MSVLLLGRRWAARTARAHSAAATLEAMVLLQTKREGSQGLALGRRVLRWADALGSLWLEGATFLVASFCGVAQDHAEALRLYSLAAAQRHYLVAQNDLGFIFH
jgi:hypothetical protein